MRLSAAVHLALGLALLGACSASGSDDRLPLGTDGTGGTGGRPAQVPGSGGSLSLGGATTPTALHADIEHEHVKVDIVTLGCPGDCADVEAVVTGGNQPYSFTWEDGSTSPRRRLCPSATRSYEVTAKDTAVTSGEFRRPAENAKASVTASVVSSCSVPDSGAPGDAGPPPPTCAPFRLLASLASGFSVPGAPLPDFTADYAPTIIVINQAVLPLSALNPACPHLHLAGDAAGTLPIGFDNNLLLELRPSEGAAVEKRWCYGAGVISFAGQPLLTPIQPTVAGFLLGIPNFVPFGYEPMAVDLATQMAGYSRFHLTATVIDGGAFGSNTEIWVIPR